MAETNQVAMDTSESSDQVEPLSSSTTTVPSVSDPRERFERRSSKSRLSKQDEVEDIDGNSPSSENSDATIVATSNGDSPPAVSTPGGDLDASQLRLLESQRSIESDKSSPTQSNPKAKLLVRSKAVCDDTSPPPDDASLATSQNTTATTTTTTVSMATSTQSVSPAVTGMARLTVSPTPHRRSKLEKDGSQGSISDNSNSPMLSRDSSMEYTDSTGTDLESFIKMTLNKNRTDRMTLLDLENKMSKFIKDSKQQYFKFPHMSSYHRMLVHRVAAFFGLDHNVDQSGKCVVVNRTSNTRIPDFNFSDHICDDMTDEPQKQILKRDDRSSASVDEPRSPEKIALNQKSKSLEERQINYEKAKNRIFNESTSQDGGLQQPRSSGSRNSLHKSSRSSSKEEAPSLEGTTHRWSSADSSGYSTDSSLKANHKITKASSFPGYAVISRADSRVGGGKIAKTDSTSSGTSGLSSPMARPPTIPSSPPPSEESSSCSNPSATSPSTLQHGGDQSPGPPIPFLSDEGQPLAIWVATSYEMIPPGSLIIDKETRQPYQNKDGSLFRWHPDMVQGMLGSAGDGSMMRTPNMSGMPPPPSTNLAPPPQPQQPQAGAGAQQQYSTPDLTVQQAQQHRQPVVAPNDVYTVPFNGQGQQQLAPPVVSVQHQPGYLPAQEPAEMSQHPSLPHQHSTESLPSEPVALVPPQGGPPPPQMYAQATPQPPAGQQQQQQPQQQIQGQLVPGQTPGYLHPPQMAFVPSVSAPTVPSTTPIRIVYQMPGYGPQRPPSQGGPDLPHGAVPAQQQQQQAQQQAQQQQALGPNGTQYSSAPYPPFSHMTVQSVETYQQQQYQPGYDTAGAPELSTGYSYPYAAQGYSGGQAAPPPPRLMAVNPQPTGATFPPGPSTNYRSKTPPSQPIVTQTNHNGASLPPQYVSLTYPNPGAMTAPPQPRPQAQNAAPPTQMWAQSHHTRMANQTPPQFMRPPAVQIGESRYVGQPLQVGARPQITSLFTTPAPRPRVQTPVQGPGHMGASSRGASNVGKGRKSLTKGSRDPVMSPQNSVESTESSEELPLYGRSALEIVGLPPSLRRADLDAYLEPLLKPNGGRIEALSSPGGSGAGDPDHQETLSNVFVVYDSDVTAARVLAIHQPHGPYKLRPVHRELDPASLNQQMPS